MVEVFAKYGAIEQIHIVTTPSSTFANIAFKTVKAAIAAIADDKKVKVGDSLVSIAKKETKTEKNDVSRERSIYIRNIRAGTTEEELRKHFESCGEIESIKLTTSKVGNAPIAFVSFVKKETVPAALILHNSVLNEMNIKVFENSVNRENKQYNESLTILLRNKQNVEYIEVAKLLSIFSECGEIDYADIICRNKILAFVTFKTEEAAAKALKMNGETVQKVQLEIESYCPMKKWTTIHVSNIPRNCTYVDVAEAFLKYGNIQKIHMVTTTRGGVFANVAFFYCRAAKKASSANRTIEILGKIVTVGLKPKKVYDKKYVYERSIHVSNIKAGTTEQQLQAHFEACGEKVERAKLMKSEKDVTPFAFIVFASKKSIPAAMKLHNSICNDSNIKLSYNYEKPDEHHYIEDYTVLLNNKNNLNCIAMEKLESIFSKCGEIKTIELFCTKNILAYITFKTKEAAAEAMKMNGQTEQEVELDLELYCPAKNLTRILIFNLNASCTENDIKNHLSKAGEIEQIVLKNKFSIVRFKTSEAFCKSFMYNETFLKGHMIFIEPHSKRKDQILEDAYNRKKKGADKKSY